MKMLLAIDIGNTNVTIGAFEGNIIQTVLRINSRPTRLVDRYGQIIKSWLDKNRFDSAAVSGVVIGSVVPRLTEPFSIVARTFFKCEALIVSCNLDLGRRILVDNPAEVGADRLCNAVAAATNYPCPCIVVDLGTATTFDVLDQDGNYIGGAIAPGLVTGASDLFRKAAQLYSVNLDFPQRVIGKNTSAHMQSGIMFGHLAMIEGMIKRITVGMGRTEIFTIATGGFSEVVASHTTFINAVDSNLTLNGLYLIYNLNRRNSGKAPKI